MIWFVSDMQRFRREQEAIRELEREAAAWLVGVGWSIENAHLLYRFELNVSGEPISLTLRYGHGFPSVPPSIFPDPPRALSGHQYNNGDLCLEYGPDTWVPNLTGADLVRSAHGLLTTEGTAPGSPAAAVPSRHELTMGQVARSENTRFLLTVPLQAFLEQAPRSVVGTGSFRFLYNDVTAVFLLASVDGLTADAWSDPELPSSLTKKRLLEDGAVVTIPTGLGLPLIPDRAALDRFLRDVGLAALDQEVDTVVIHCDTETRLLWFHEGKSLSVLTLRARPGQRLASEHAQLNSKKVGIVGCGSLGSKLAVMLARAGVDKFVLIDDDVFFPENIVRHELAWSDVGQHKAEALAKRIELVAPSAKSTVRKQRVGGQESNSVADSTVGLLQDCDLIVDASAEPTVFNVLSGAAGSSAKPLLWAEVFAGGIGGLIARSRPGIDPPPQDMRASVNAWCAAQGVAPPRPTGGYGAESEQGTWLADDTDVTVIAAHAARFAVDLLLERTPSVYADSCYLLGLTQAWVFQAPFDTIPIGFGELQASPSPPFVESDPETFAAILGLISKGNAEAHPAP
ncbi:MAG: ThiF family adenylyltransferase [Labilithrix sp.]|nr:ThiF family adenylyltransferase [Labilithrix sp.]